MDNSTTKERVYKARAIDEALIKQFFERRGYTVEQSNREEDFQGIDLKVYNPEGHRVNIDVKCSSNSNQNTNNFLYTTVSNGKSYKTKKTDYIVYIDHTDDSITMISMENLSALINESKEYKSIRHDNGYFVLLNKDEVKSLGYVYKI